MKILWKAHSEENLKNIKWGENKTSWFTTKKILWFELMLVFLVAVKRNQKYIHFLAHNTTCLVICHFFADFFVPFSRKLGEKPLFSVYNLLHNFSTTVIIETTVSCSFSEKSQRCLMPNIKKLIYKNFQKLSGFSFVQFSGNTCDIRYVPAAW